MSHQCPVCKGEVEVTKQSKFFYEVRLWCPACEKRGSFRECVSCKQRFVSLTVIEPVWKDGIEVVKGQCTSDHHCTEAFEKAKEAGLKSAEMLAVREYEQARSYHRKLTDGFRLLDAADNGEYKG